MNKSLLSLGFGAFCAVLVGCSSLSEKELQDYQVPPPVVKNGKPLMKSLYVASIKDLRPEEHRIVRDINDVPLILIPLWPYSSQEINPLMRHNFFQDTLAERMQILFAKDLRGSGISDKLLVASAANPDLPVPAGFYQLELTIKRAVWNRSITAYGLSSAGGVFWALGLPVSYGNVELELEVLLKSPKSGEIIGRNVISKKIGCTEFVYDQIDYNPAKSEVRMAEMFPQIAHDLRMFIVNTLE